LLRKRRLGRRAGHGAGRGEAQFALLETLSAAAWVFAIFRVLHSAVHCTFNLVMLRFYLYLVSALAV
jgi:hypothetical protein